ncbi:VirK family protein [Paraburkholderia sediminicola]|uniref:VirK family protein n=1 Tax=Paraburkholderia sediminicola TaxID=458836 RepID=UPI0038B7FFC2
MSHYEQLRALLFSGAPTTVIFTPAQCSNSLQSGNAAPSAAMSGGFAIRDFMEVSANHIGFADEHFTVRPDDTAVLEFMQYRVMPTDTATITVRSLSPVTYQPPQAVSKNSCRIAGSRRCGPEPHAAVKMG